MTDATNPPAGWYDDGRGLRRYWDGTQWTEYTAPLASAEAPTAADQYAATTPYSFASTDTSAGAGAAGQFGGGAGAPGPYAPPGAPGAQTPGKVNVLGVVALVLAVIGFILAWIPFVQVIALIALPIAFVLSLVALFLEGRKWPAITGLVVSIVGGIVGTLVFTFVTLGMIGQIADSDVIREQIEEQLEEQFGTPVPPEDAPDEAPDAGAVQGLAFGDTMTWDDGVSMTVSEPEPFSPSDISAGADQAVHLVVTLTITNDSPENVQPVVLSTMSSGGTEATRIFDLAAEGGQVGIPPTTAVLPGESITWREAWSVADAESLTMQTAPSFQYETVIFTNVPQ